MRYWFHPCLLSPRNWFLFFCLLCFVCFAVLYTVFRGGGGLSKKRPILSVLYVRITEDSGDISYFFTVEFK